MLLLFIIIIILGKAKSKKATVLASYENIESNEKEVAKNLNDFFLNVVKNLEILEHQYPLIQIYKLW